MVSKNSKESGFSLIEVAIALIVISLLMTPLIYLYNVHMEKKRFTMTAARTDGVRAALLKFYERNGYYPIPATPSIAQGTPGFGVSATMPGPGWPACLPTSTVVCSAANTGFGTLPAATNRILIGSVPIAALGLPYKAMLDGYGNRLTYAISQNLTTIANFRDDRGAVRIRKNSGPDAQAHFAIVSHGKTRRGAFTLAGVRGIPCNTVLGPAPADRENCNNDGTFLSNEDGGGKIVINEGNTTSFFDDNVVHMNTTAYGLWSYIPNSALDMQSRITGNIKIGCSATVPCKPLAKLDVEGDVLANEVQTSRICDSDEHRCLSTWGATPAGVIPPRVGPLSLGWFSPTMLTGAPTTPLGPVLPPTSDSGREGRVGEGIGCYNDYALKGIRGYDEYCAGQGATSTPRFTATSVTNCPGGQNARGIIITGANSFSFDCVVSW